jgi:hypothetical protein
MKKTSTTTRKLRRLILPATAFLSISFTGCAFTDYGNRINQEQLEIARLEDKRQNLETQYIIVLNNLEMHPAEERLLKERDEVRRKLIDLSSLLNDRRKLLDQSFQEWEQKIVHERIEREMVDREIRDNEGKNEDVEFENK